MHCFDSCCHKAEDTSEATIIVASPALPEKEYPVKDAPVEVEANAKESPVDGEGGKETEDQQCEEFEVRIDKEAHGPVGLDIGSDRKDDGLIVKLIPAGPVTAWNSKAEENCKIREGDRIVQVNDVRGSSALLFDELHKVRSSTRLTLRMRRRQEVRVQFPIGQGQIGLELTTSKSRESLVVKSIKDGVVKAWIDENVSEAMQVGDRIVEINGTRGEPNQLLEKLRRASHLDIVFVRFS